MGEKDNEWLRERESTMSVCVRTWEGGREITSENEDAQESENEYVRENE